MGTLFGILVGVYFIVSLVWPLVKKIAPKLETGDTATFRGDLEKRLRRFVDQAEWFEDENGSEKEAMQKAGKKKEKRLKQAGEETMGDFPPDLEGMSSVAPVMSPGKALDKGELQIKVLKEDAPHPSSSFLPTGRKAKRELLKKGVVLKDILEPKYF